MSTMLQQLRKVLIVELDRELSLLGFKLKKTERTFYKQIPPIVGSLSVAYIAHPGKDFDVTIDVDVRYEQLETLINRLNPYMSKQSAPDTVTVGGDIGNISIHRQRRWTVITEANLISVVPSILQAIREIAFPYFQRFSSLEEILTVCSSEEFGITTHCPSDLKRAEKAIAAAYLLGRKETYEELVKRKTHFLKYESRQHWNLDEFFCVVEGLNKCWEEREQATIA